MESYNFSITGTNHKDNGQENQDFIISSSNDKFELIILADGVSTCSKAKEGAEVAAKAIETLFLKKGDWFIKCEDDKQRTELILGHVLRELQDRAKADGVPVEEYSSTLAAVLREKKTNKLLTFNLGNSLIMAIDDGKVRILSSPSNTTHGTAVTTTRKAESLADTKVINGTPKITSTQSDKDGNIITKPLYSYGSTPLYENIVICSDGAWEEMFYRGKLIPEISALLVNKQFDTIKEFLEKKNPFDDCSFVALDLNKMKYAMQDGISSADELETIGREMYESEQQSYENNSGLKR